MQDLSSIPLNLMVYNIIMFKIIIEMVQHPPMMSRILSR